MNDIKFFYCLVMPSDDERWNQCVDEFIKVRIPYVERIDCIPHENKFLSFNHSNYNTIKKGYETGEPFCIFESDVVFDERYKHIEEAFKQLPEDWDILYLGCNFIGSDLTTWRMPERYSAHLHRLYNAWQSHAIVYSNKGAKFVLDNFKPDEFPVLDEWIRVNMMQDKQVFVLNPMSVYQRPNFSGLWGLDVDYTYCHFHGNKLLKEL